MEDNECRDGGKKVRLAIMELANMISVPMSLTAAIRLHVPNAILQRILRLLTSYGVFSEHRKFGGERRMNVMRMMIGNMLKNGLQKLYGKEMRLLSGRKRPTSNPLPPQSEAFADHQNAQQALETVAQQDKAHCPFHLKTGACRFGQRCSRVHFYPNKSCTLLIKNMYNGPGLAWEQDEGLKSWSSNNGHYFGRFGIVCHNTYLLTHVVDEEVERSYEEFYEDVHTEFLKFGEIVNFKVCRNGSSHLRGSVYVHYKSLESAILAYHSVNGCYFTGKQITCEFVNVTRWKIAICGEYMKSRLKTCSRGMACNFIHCFRNPGGDYEWADWDKPPPRYWVKKMAALFGYSDESGTWNQERSG
ncbi:hypothetical protein WN943_010688 [Citrus x changshan-huyou]